MVAARGETGLIVLDHIRTVDRARLVERLGSVTDATLAKALGVLGEMFAP